MLFRMPALPAPLRLRGSGASGLRRVAVEAVLARLDVETVPRRRHRLADGGVGVNRHGSVEGPLDVEAVVVRCRHGRAWGGAV